MGRSILKFSAEVVPRCPFGPKPAKRDWNRDKTRTPRRGARAQRTLGGPVGVPQTAPTVLYVDNQGAVELSKDAKTCHRSRHVLRRFFKVREPDPDAAPRLLRALSGGADPRRDGYSIGF